MLLRKDVLQGIVDGSIDRVFRRWTKPTVKTGGRLRTRMGELSIDQVDVIDMGKISSRDAKRAGFTSLDALKAFLNSRSKGEVYRVQVSYQGADSRIALRQQSKLTANELTAIVEKLDRMDKASRHGAWTRKTLALIAKHPARLALELAKEMKYEKPLFKRNVRKLKELGLTESLKVGYRLSPRGKTVMGALEKARSS